MVQLIQSSSAKKKTQRSTCFIVITAIVIIVNLVSHELVILMGKNGYVRIIFEIKILNSNLPALRGRLVCVYPYF